MITAITTVSCEVGKVHEVAQALVDCPGVAEVYSVSGEYDLLAIIRVKEYDELAEVVAGSVGSVKGITKTQTHMAFRCYSKQNMERMWGEFIGDGE
jgi:DNA-binding Lrp family transcriptional regulator